MYYNFCSFCSCFQPKDKKYRDFELNKHLCNYGIPEMPDQKMRNDRKAVKLREQVFSDERTEQVKVLEQNADLVRQQAATLLAKKVKRKREAVAKAEHEAKVIQKRK